MGMRFSEEQQAKHRLLLKILDDDRRENGVDNVENVFLLLLQDGIGDSKWLAWAMSGHNYYRGYALSLLNLGYYKQMLSAWIKTKMGVKSTYDVDAEL